MKMPEQRVREAARVLVLAPDQGQGPQVLLARMEIDTPARGKARFWTAPGGQRDAGEAWEACAARELREETGLELDLIGPVISRKRPTVLMGSYTHIFELYWLAHLPDAHPVALPPLEESEASALKGLHWWSANALATTSDVVFPPRLSTLLRDLPHQAPGSPRAWW